MRSLSEEIGRITNLLEDAVEEQDWDMVKKMIEALDDVYEELEKSENGFNYDFD